MPKLRALIVDDATVMRRLLTEVLKRDPGIEVAGTAPNGRIALEKLTQINPDFITLDVEMPEMDGLETLREIRKTHPKLPVIMFSLLTQRGAAATLDALAAGANDYVTKPSSALGLEDSMARLEQELLPKIRAHFRQPATVVPVRPAVMASPKVRKPATRGAKPFDLLCIATSTGGPNALNAVFGGLTTPLPVPVVIVQHMPPMFTGLLAERIDRLPGCAVRCSEALEGESLLPGHAYIAPGGRHLAVERHGDGHYRARLLDTPAENSCRPAADVLFRSVAEAGAQALALVMTGMGEDGLRGCEHLSEQGATILIQDEASSVIWGMPGAVARAGLAHTILPLGEIAGEITRRLGANIPVLS
jgi:two-component system, chemotaxis family, protein-glutamate methylesterase/glutaminase